jgi:uncharacterized NAD-dependent epimerase/dehydratase family protein
MEGAVTGPAGKMGFGILRYSHNPITCVIDSQTAGRSIGTLTGIDRECPIVESVRAACDIGADVFVLGIAPHGGLIPASWWSVIREAVEAGLSIVNGLHDLVGPHFPDLKPVPSTKEQFVWDIRIEPQGLGNGNGAAASLKCRRVLLIGTDMSVGKMTAGLEIAKEAERRGIPTGFVATGQIGITITGGGVPLDAIRVDFASGAIQREVLEHDQGGAQIVVVEGQGSLIHPGSTANLPLLRGSCPTHLVLCHRAGQTSLLHLPHVRIPPLDRIWRLYEDLGEACGTFPRPKTVAIALNTAHLAPMEAEAARSETEMRFGLPCADPIRDGAGRLLDAVLA